MAFSALQAPYGLRRRLSQRMRFVCGFATKPVPDFVPRRGRKCQRVRDAGDAAHRERMGVVMLSSSGFSVGRWLSEKILMDFDPSPELAAILTVYFIQGALGISRLAL